MLKQEYKNGELNVQSALQLAIKVLSKTLDTNKLTSEKAEIATLTRIDGQTQVTILNNKEVAALIKQHEEEEAKAEAEKKKSEKASS